MQIVKKFDLEMAHIVRNAWSKRCSKSIHGHTYTVEVVLERSDQGMFDDGQMVIDFGLVKKHIGPFIDSFDHATMLWAKDEDPELVNFFKDHFDRVIVCNQSSSCEMMSAILLVGIERLLASNDETDMVEVTKVIVHETKSGRAECDCDSEWVTYVEEQRVLEEIFISDPIIDEWSYEFVNTYVAAGIGSFGVAPREDENSFISLNDDTDLSDEDYFAYQHEEAEAEAEAPAIEAGPENLPGSLLALAFASLLGPKDEEQ